MNVLNRLKLVGKTASHDRTDYWNYQVQIGNYYLENFVIPYNKGKKVLDVGCGEGGVLSAFERQGYACVGLEYNPDRVEYARKETAGKSPIISGDIQNFKSREKYDVVLILDVIEHLRDKTAALKNMKALLEPGGIIIVSFPPFRSPFGGHQQVMRSWMKYFLYVHLLPRNMYTWLLNHVEKQKVNMHLSNYETGLTTRTFEKLVHQTDLKIVKKELYFVRPRQALRFDLPIRKYKIKFFSEFFSSGATYVLIP